MSKTRAYVLIMAVAGIELTATAFHTDRLLDAPVWFWLLAGFAVLRAARTISFNAIGAPIRERFTLTEPDGSGAGDTVNPRPGSVIGELLACPICTGMHAAALILLVYSFAPGFGLVLVAALGLAGVSEVLNWLACLLEWKGNEARELTGKMVREREAEARLKKDLERLQHRMQEQITRDAFRFNWRMNYGLDANGWRSSWDNKKGDA